jgi:outer membrane protein assembly factor BamA
VLWLGLLGVGVVPSAVGQQGLQRDLAVRGLKFSGNHAIDDYTLSISIATSNSSWWKRATGFLGEERYFDELEFRRDVLRIQALYRLSGYLEARVDTLVRRGKDDVRITFIITEGAPVRVTEVKVTGADGAMPAREILRDLPLKVGDAFSRFRLRSSVDSIRTWLQDRGHPFVEVFSGYEEDSVARTAKVSYTVDPGRLARISAVAVTGTQKVSPRVVRRAVGLRAGQPFSR